ncbi:MAG: HU family DNA-binding protein [Deltaproteobacteria bacterium]|jgi:DNA-binding protein HU-beta|nr:HU family DNA-binding protein [Deltaproteobacteria bacterium]
MTKNELISQISNDTGFSRPNVQKILESVINTVVLNLKKELRMPIFGLGVFEVVKRAKRKGRNPRTGESLTVKAHNAVRFKASKHLKEAVNSISKLKDNEAPRRSGKAKTAETPNQPKAKDPAGPNK